MQDPKSPRAPQYDALGIGFGAFLVLAGLLTLAEYTGLIPASVKWGMPTIAVIIGGIIIYNSLQKRG